MASITMFGTKWQILNISKQKCDFKVILMSIESNIVAPVLLNLSNLLQKSDNMLG